MNILLINHYAGSNRYGMEYRPFYLAREWVRMGHLVTIVAASYSHLRIQTPILNGQCTNEKIEGIQYWWLKTPSYKGNGIRRAINIFSFVFQLYHYQKQLIHGCKSDAVIASSTYPLDIFPAKCIAHKMKARLIYEVHDLWPLSLIEIGGMSIKHPFIRLLQWAEDFAYRNADMVVSILPKANGYMQSHGMLANKFVYIPNGIDIKEWENNQGTIPDQHLKKLRQIKQDGRYIIGYAGAHGLANSLECLISAAFLLKEYPVTFVLVGQGPEKDNLQKMVSQKNMLNVLFLPYVLKSSIPALLGLMDILYIGWKKEPLYRFGVSPNKLFDYMMAAKPVIQAIEAGNDLVTEIGCGISVPPDDPYSIVEAVLRMMKMSSSELEMLGQRGRAYVQSCHDYKVLAQHFLDVIENGNQR